MHVGLIAPPWVPVPPPFYGGTEAVVDALARGLADAGCEVTLFAAGDSTCPVKLESAIERAPGIYVGGPALEVDHVVAAYEALRHVDVIHDHTVFGPFYGPSRTSVPVVTTNHNPFARPFSTLYRLVGDVVPVIAISAHHAASAGDIPIRAVIHHGVPLTEFPYGEGRGGYALFIGRMTPEKGAHRAARVAAQAGVPLIMAGKMQTAAEFAYYEEEVLPLLGEGAEYLGEIDQKTKLTLMGDALCLLNPIAWDEPFGMVMIEALACGTPVLALSYGAAPEIVDDGVTGILAHGEDDLVAGLWRAPSLERAACRAAAEERFSQQRMVAEHLALYTDLIAARA